MKKAIFIFVAVLIQLEIVLRLTGFALDRYQAYRNRRHESDAIRIMTIGESTTADAVAKNGRSWPRILEEILRKKGHRIQVINVARPAVTSTVLMRALKENLDQHNPHIVISMMGVNDSNRFWLGRLVTDGSLLQNIRILKLAKFLWNLRGAAKAIASPQLIVPSTLDHPEIPRLLAGLEKGKEPEVMQEIEHFLRDKTALEKSQFHAHLGNLILPPSRDDHAKEMLSLKFLAKAAEHSLDVDFVPENVVLLAVSTAQPGHCKVLVGRYLAEEKTPSEIFLQRIADCLPGDRDVQNLMAKYGSDYAIAPPSSRFPTAENYAYLLQTLRSKGICLIAMQYPTLPLKNLMTLFPPELIGNPDSNLFFASNEANFKTLLQSHRVEEVFTDLFARTFGHATDLGNQHIAEAAADGVIRVLQSKKCL